MAPILASSQPHQPHFATVSNCVTGKGPEVLTGIYNDEINIAVHQRVPSTAVLTYCQQLANARPHFTLRAVLRHERAQQTLTSIVPALPNQDALVKDLCHLMDMYACLFDLDEIGIRLEVLDRAMCPRFHTDKLGCRMITTYRGAGTEWLHNSDVDRSKLGTGSCGLNDKESGLFKRDEDIQQVTAGDVVLLKGEGWINNEGIGVVHRSPTVAEGEKRVVVTMDFA